VTRTCRFIACAIALWLAACADPLCPPDFVKDGDQCKRCPDGKPASNWRCLSESEAGVGADKDASSQTETTFSPDALAPDPSATTNGAVQADASATTNDATPAVQTDASSTLDAAESGGLPSAMDAQQAVSDASASTSSDTGPARDAQPLPEASAGNDAGSCGNAGQPSCDAGSSTACQTDSDCTGRMSGLTALDACYLGECVDCRIDPADTKRDIGCPGKVACDPATRTCIGTVKGILRACEPCLADAECGVDQRCITMKYQGAEIRPKGAAGGFCLAVVSSPPNCARPFTRAIVRGSRSGAPTDQYCGIDEAQNACDAVRTFGATCTGGVGGCITPEGDPAVGVRCETINATPMCTYSCSSGNSNECPGATMCPAGTNSYCGGQ
jgi:hypothetical protein